MLVPTIIDIVNLSVSSGEFHPTLKQSVISSLLKKATLDKDQLSNYRPISELSLLSKIIERVVKSRLTHHFSSNNTTLLRNALQHVSSWMTANPLTLNTSKTEFLLRLKQQLAKFHNCLIETTHSARNLGIIFDEHLTFSDQISSLSKFCYFHIRALRCIHQYLDFRMPVLLPHLLFTPNLTTAVHYTSIYQILK